MIVHKHKAGMCPGGTVKPDKQFIEKFREAVKKSGVKLVEGYLNGLHHEFWFLMETNDIEALDNAVWPLATIGKVRIVPVSKFADALAWAKKAGIQK